MKRFLMLIGAVLAVGLGVLGALWWEQAPDSQAVRHDAGGPQPAVARTAGLIDSPATGSVRLDPEALAEYVRESYMAKQVPSRTARVSEELNAQLAETSGLLSQIESEAEARQPVLLSLLESKQMELEVLRDEADRWLESRGTPTRALRARVGERFSRVDAALKAVVDAPSAETRGQAVQRARSLLTKLRPPQAAPDPQPTFSMESVSEPGLVRVPEGRPPAYITQGAAPTTATGEAGGSADLSVVLDWLGGREVHAAQPPTMPLPEAQACGYEAADVSDALPEVEVDHPEILTLAETLDYSPLRIFEYVKNNIAFQPYYGSLKGAVGTLMSGSGNDTDQSSLLIALLRASKIPARYVKARVRVPEEDPRVLDWLGVKTTVAAKKRLLVNSHYAVTDSGLLWFAHVWVEACVPYDNYRGSAADASGHQWIPLDASFKRMHYREGETVPDDFEFNYETFLSTRTTKMPHEALRDQLYVHLGRELDGAGRTGEIVPERIDMLPATLPFEVDIFVNWTGTGRSDVAALPDAHRHEVTFELMGEGSAPLLVPSLTVTMPELATQRITLSFAGETQSDRDAISVWQQTNGAMPCTTTSVKGVFRLEGADITPSGTSTAVDLCNARNELRITIPELRENVNVWGFQDKPVNQVHYTNIGAHNYHALQAYAFQASPALLESRSEQLLALVGSESDPNALQDEILGEYLHITGLKYMGYIAEAGSEIGRLHDETGDSGHHIGLTSTRMRVEYLFDLPYGVSGHGFLIDVPGGSFRGIDRSTGLPGYDAFLLTGYAGSAYESYIWQELAHLDAVSSVRGIQFAKDTGVDFVTLSSVAEVDTDINTNCPSRTRGEHTYATLYQEPHKTALKDLFNNKFYSRITLPTCLLLYEDWFGFVWVAEYRVDLSKYDLDLVAVASVAEIPNAGSSLVVIATVGPDLHVRIFDAQGRLTADKPESQLSEGSALTTLKQLLSPLPDESTLSTQEIEEIIALAARSANHPYLQYSTGFTIAGEYVGGASGGYTLPVRIDNNYNPVLRTGTKVNLSEHAISQVTKSVGATDITFTPIEAGNGTGAGNVPTRNTTGGDPVNLYSGNMFHNETDLAIKGRGGLDLVFERYYNSNVRKDGPLGYGWTHSFNHKLNFFDESGNGLTDLVVWVDGTGATHQFTVGEDAGGGVVNGGPAFTAQPGLYVEARREAPGEYTIKERNGLTFRFEDVAGTPGQEAKLLEMVDRNGNKLVLNYVDGRLDSIQDGLSRTLSFHYDDQDDHITRIVDWTDRTFQYEYDNDNLVRFKDPLALQGEKAPTVYDYYSAADGTNLDRAMRSFTYPNGNGMTFEYYTNGKTFRHTDSQGQTFTFRYNKFRRETTTVDERGVEQTYLFNEWGQQTQHVQGDGSRMRYEYQNIDHPLEETLRYNPLGYKTHFAYTPEGDLTGKTLPDGTVIEYLDFNAFHQPTRTRDGEGNVTLYRYDASGNQTDIIVLKTGVDPQNPATFDPMVSSSDVLAWTIKTYDEHGNLETSKRVRNFPTRAGPYIEYEYDANHLNVLAVRRCGRQQTSAGDLTEHCEEAGQVSDPLGRPTTLAGADLYTAQMVYDDLGRVVRATDATNRWRDYQYDGNGNLISESLVGKRDTGKVELLVQDVTQYDALDRPTLVTDVAGLPRRIAYDEAGNVLQVTDPDGYVVRFEYDAMGRATRAFDQQGHAIATEYDVAGRPIKVTDPNGNSTTYAYYDRLENGRLRRLTQADGRFIDYEYDDKGNVTKIVDNAGNEQLTDYDALNRPVRQVGPVHDSHNQNNIRQVTITKYTNLGYVEQVEAGYTNEVADIGADVVSLQASYVYDDFGRLISETDALGRVTSYVYDKHGNLLRTEMPNGHIVEAGYDHARNGLLRDRAAKLSTNDPDPQVTTWTYDDLGQVTGVTAPEVNYTYRHDAANRLVQVTDSRAGKALHYDYSPGGLLNHTRDSEGKRVDYLYDAAGRLTNLQTPNGKSIGYAFDAAGRLRERSLGDEMSARYSYDAGDKLRSVVNRTTQGVISEHQYDYDDLGRRTIHTETVGGVTTPYGYDYDKLGRLTGVRHGATPKETYSYDPLGNRRTRAVAGGATYHYDYDDGQQLRSVHQGSLGGAMVSAFVYDAAGSLKQRCESGTVTRPNDTTCTGDEILTLVYDALERMRSADLTGANSVAETYGYGPGGTRIEKTSNGAVTRYLHDGADLWAEYGASWDDALAHYVHEGLDAPVLRLPANAADARYYHQDGLGSVVAVTDAAGAIAGSRRYDAWGNVLAESGSMPRFGYTGREPDATGLVYYRARYYDPGIGRFTQRDPAGFADGMNLYAYVGNSPASFVDPLGMMKQVPRSGGGGGTAYGGNRGGGFGAQPYTGSMPDNGIAASSLVEPLTMMADAGASHLADLAAQARSQGSRLQALGYETAVYGLIGAVKIGELLGGNKAKIVDDVVEGFGRAVGRGAKRGPVVFRAPPGATAEEIAQVKEYCKGCNAALVEGALSPTGRVSTKGNRRRQATRAAAKERQNGNYVGHAGHVPDTTWTGKPQPPSWMDLTPKVNSSLGGQARRYPVGYKPTRFIYRE